MSENNMYYFEDIMGMPLPEPKSLRDYPVKRLYTVHYTIIKNHGGGYEGFMAKMEKRDINYRQKTIKLVPSGHYTHDSKVYKRDEEFTYNIKSVRGYFSCPIEAYKVYKKAIQEHVSKNERSLAPIKIELLNECVKKIREDVDLYIHENFVD